MRGVEWRAATSATVTRRRRAKLMAFGCDTCTCATTCASTRPMTKMGEDTAVSLACRMAMGPWRSFTRAPTSPALGCQLSCTACSSASTPPSTTFPRPSRLWSHGCPSLVSVLVQGEIAEDSDMGDLEDVFLFGKADSEVNEDGEDGNVGLGVLEKKLSASRRKDHRQRQNRLCDELVRVVEKHNVSQLWIVVTAAQWIQYLSQRGSEGGCSAGPGWKDDAMPSEQKLLRLARHRSRRNSACTMSTS
mmetsp:Transcript_61606/g.201065  ORF Transcript_61606/g.201065 Transcript_61606/m.201065 type:complete len:247 (+) Transcript_61606:103-843(+)